GLYSNETSELCDWHIPEAHFLESWGDARAYDGTVSVIQPLIAPLYDGRSAHEVLSALLGDPGKSPHDIVHDYWKNKKGGKDFETFWETTLHDGVMPGTAFPLKVPATEATLSDLESLDDTKRKPAGASRAGGGRLEIIYRPDPTVWDGNFSNNGWLQELPK